MNQRKAAIQKIIRLIVEDLEEEGKGNLTSIYAIGLLKEAIADIEHTALMRPVVHSVQGADVRTIAHCSNAEFRHCSITSSVVQTSTNVRAIGFVFNSSGCVRADVSTDKISGFTHGIYADWNSEAYASIEGSVSTQAYTAIRGSTVNVNTAAMSPVKAPNGAISESNGGRIRFSHLQGVNNTITIHVSPAGDDANWGQNAANAVRTIARARDIAQRCEGTGSIVIQIADGNYDLSSTVRFTSTTRNITIHGNASNRSAVNLRINHADAGLSFG